jgi:hypothetical protein
MTNKANTLNLTNLISEKANQLRVLSSLAMECQTHELLGYDLELLFSLSNDLSTQISTLIKSVEIEVSK